MAVPEASGMLPLSSSTTPNFTQGLLPYGNVATLEMVIIGVGVVPLVALIGFAVMKLHHRVYRRQRSNMQKRGPQRHPKIQSDAEYYLQLKPELAIGGARFEMNGDEPHEKSADEITELPTQQDDLRVASQRWRQELAGEGHSRELEASY